MSEPALSLPEWLQGRVLVVDGATGTELERRGVPTPRPLWSAAALATQPDVVEAIHRDYAAAGADIVVANTFRTNVRTLRAAGLLERGEELNRTAIELARRAAQAADHRLDAASKADRKTGACESAERRRIAGAAPEVGATARKVWVAASVAPVEDCYSPELVPDKSVLDEEHGQMLEWLQAAKPDLIWIETMNTVREARAAAHAAAEAALPFVVSFVVRENGDLLSGERLEDAVAAVEQLGPLALGLNCIPPNGMTAILPRLRKATKRPLVAYAHINNAEPIFGWSYSQSATPGEYAEHVRRWLDLGVSIVGGCCGTTPAHIRAVIKVVGPRCAS
ncbi:MAG: homocysteine S-methyltransferase family protein [Phycisphaerae bacterium]